MYMTPLDFFVEIILPYGVFLTVVQTAVEFDLVLGKNDPKNTLLSVSNLFFPSTAIVGSLFAMYEHSGYCFTYGTLLLC